MYLNYTDIVFNQLVVLDTRTIGRVIMHKKRPILITGVYAVRTVAFSGDSGDDFALGIAGHADKFLTKVQANLEAAVPAGESAGVEFVAAQVYVPAGTDITLVWPYLNTTLGRGRLIIQYIQL